MSALLRNFLPAVAPHEVRPTPMDVPGAAARAPPQPTRADPIELSTLLSRVETSSVLDERRRALAAVAGMLTNHPELLGHVRPAHVSMIMAVLRQFIDEPSIATSALEILVAISGMDMNRAPQAGEILHAMMDVELLLLTLRSGDFWNKYHAVQLLCRLHRVEPAQFATHLLQMPNAVAELVDVLNDPTNGGALRDEGLPLFLEMTGPHGNLEVITILSFQGCFESLYAIIKDEGGAHGGSVIVRDCLSIIQNMVRRNKNVQKYFRDMGLARQVGDLLKTQFGDVQNGHALAVDHGSLSVLSSAVETVRVFVEGADHNGEGPEARDNLVSTGVVAGLCTLTFQTIPSLRRDDAEIEIDAIRTMARCVAGCVAAANVVVEATAKIDGGSVGALRHLLGAALMNANIECQAAATALINAVVATSGTNATQQLVRGLAPKPGTNVNCGQLLGPYLFVKQKPTPATHFIACHLLAASVGQSAGLAEQIVTTEWDNRLVFFTAYLGRAVELLRERRLTIPDASATLRPIIFAVRTTPKALLVLLSNSQHLRFFAEWAVSCPDGFHIRFLCASIVALTALKARELGSTPPGSLTVAQADELFASTITHKVFDALYQSVTNSSEWSTAPRGSALAELPKQLAYDGGLVNLLAELRDAVQRTNVQLQPVSHLSTSAPPSPVAQLPPGTPPPPSSAEVDHLRSTTHAAQEEAARLQAVVAQLQAQLAATTERLAAAAVSTQGAKDQSARALDELRRAKHEADEAAAAAEARAEAQADDVKQLSLTIDALQTKLRSVAGDAQELHRLQSQLADVEAERDELLLLVAELDELRE
jgi:hypothetical protein